MISITFDTCAKFGSNQIQSRPTILMEQRTLTGRWMLEELEASFSALQSESVVVLSKTDFMAGRALAELGQHQELIQNRFLPQIQIKV